jgi:hypothetical protein
MNAVPAAIPGPNTRAAIGTGLLLVGAFVAAMLLLMQQGSYERWAALLLTPILVLVTVPALVRQARREQNPSLAWILTAALLLKLCGAIVRSFVEVEVYEGIADASGYHGWGVRLYEQFRAGDFDTDLKTLTSTDFIRFFTGIVYAIIGPTRIGGFVFYSWLGFIGLFYFYRAFVVAVPEGRTRSYAFLLFLLPTNLFWPSAIGKDAWMVCALGIMSFGIARALSGSLWHSVAPAALGFWLGAYVRPHVVGMMGVAVLGAYLFKKPSTDLGQLAPVVKLTSVTAVGVLAFFAVINTERFLENSGIDTERGVTGVLEENASNTSIGGSSYVPSILSSPRQAPVALATVLFRPFIFEAHNEQMLLAALEGTFLMLLFLVRFRWFVAALKSIRRQPYIALAFMYAGLFIVAFSSMANFGLLARERSQLFPLVLALFAVPPARKSAEPASTI